MAAEVSRFTDDVDVHALPGIFHYWSNRYLRPLLEGFGFPHPDAFFAMHVGSCLAAATGPRRRVASIGAGNCDTEVRLARALVDAGQLDFAIECLEINDAMRERGAALAAAEGVAAHVIPVRVDFNHWEPEGRYDAIVANQSLHHVLELEVLFDAVARSLAPHGRFVVSDMIGRNGHQRWPEALAIVREFWRELPASHRYNLQLQRMEETFLDWDCAQGCFEGVRAQDILPLCIERFGFELFVPFANVIDPFIDRGFGHHFDAEREWDRAFIDRVHARDAAEIDAGRITPTHMMAVLRVGEPGARRFPGHLAPEFCVRDPGRPDVVASAEAR